MQRRCPNQRRRRCRRRDDAVGSLVRLQRMSNTSNRRRSARIVDHDSEPSEPQSKTETTRVRSMLILVFMLMRCLRKIGFDRRHNYSIQCNVFIQTHTCKHYKKYQSINHGMFEGGTLEVIKPV